MKKTLPILLLIVFTMSCATSTKQVQVKPNQSLDRFLSQASQVIKGVASWYGNPFHGRKTANGERYNMYEYTAAHKTLPFGSRLLVINPLNNRSLMVRVNDRGPYIAGRELDLSFAAARDLGLLGSGTGSVTIAVYPPVPKINVVAAVAKYTKSLARIQSQINKFSSQIAMLTNQMRDSIGS